MNAAATLFVTVSGRVVDMFAPNAAMIDFDDIAEHLAKEARYNGGTPHVFYSVAQHLCLAADWVIAEATGRQDEVGSEDFPHGSALVEASKEARLAAAYVLAHDFHEYVLKDDTTPKKRALDRVAQETLKLEYGVISEADMRLTERWDAAIHEAAGLTWPPPGETSEFVDVIDKRMLVTEWAALHTGSRHRPHKLLGDYSAYEPLPIKVEPWCWQLAQEQLATRMHALLPCFRKSN